MWNLLRLTCFARQHRTGFCLLLIRIIFFSDFWFWFNLLQQISHWWNSISSCREILKCLLITHLNSGGSMSVLMTPAYVAMMESITQARNTRASLFTYLQKGGEQMWVPACGCMFVYVYYVPGYLLHPNKHNQRHQEQAACPVDTHVVEQCCAFTIFIFSFKYCCCRNDVHLAVDRQQTQRQV